MKIKRELIVSQERHTQQWYVMDPSDDSVVAGPYTRKWLAQFAKWLHDRFE